MNDTAMVGVGAVLFFLAVVALANNGATTALITEEIAAFRFNCQRVCDGQ